VVDVPVERRDGDVDKARMKLMRREVAVSEQSLDDAQTNRVQQCGGGHAQTVSVSILKTKLVDAETFDGLSMPKHQQPVRRA